MSIAAKKSLGQNFLVDPKIAQRIAEAADIQCGDCVIEIGPGTGALTRPLLDRVAQIGARLIAVELDPRMIELLPTHDKLSVIHADALEVDFAALANGAPVRFVSNLPYYITSALIRRMLESGADVRTLILTMQLEVARRIIAQPPEMSLLSVSVQFYGAPSLLFRVPPSAFKPQPNVDSAVLRITPHAALPQIDVDCFFNVVRAGFCQPRKQLRNTLAAGLTLDKIEAAMLLMRAKIDPLRRAETLMIGEWVALTQVHGETHSQS